MNVGMDAKSLSEILGHSDVYITLNRYVHSNVNAKKKYLEKLKNRLVCWKSFILYFVIMY
ncbi:MAG: hypothetical protein IKF38_03310 [Clostridia bacterium]|nr:hypothetical protein [Clostridia bacterium]